MGGDVYDYCIHTLVKKLPLLVVVDSGPSFNDIERLEAFTHSFFIPC
jgi:hypothetical protein